MTEEFTEDQMKKLDKETRLILEELDAFLEGDGPGDTEVEIHESDLADALVEVKKIDEERYLSYIQSLPVEIRGEVILELPETYQEELALVLPAEEWVEIVNELETDDATDMVQVIEEQDEDKAYNVLAGLEEEHKEDIEVLKRYDEYTAGAIMQVELFSARLNETIAQSVERLRKMKADDELENVHYVFITDDENKLVGILSLEDLLLQDFDQTYEAIQDEMSDPIICYSYNNYEEVAQLVERYNLSVIPVVDNFKHLLGRITSDDIYDMIEETATDQIYSLANVDTEEELEDSVMETGKKRAWWLGINLITAVVASLVIGLFSDTIDNIVALAILMPIVASMGGIAGTQTLTVIVRSMALGELDSSNARIVVLKELRIGVMNGIIFSLAVTLLATVWFKEPMIGLVMAVAMLVNLIVAGLSGAGIPMLLKKIGVDPAIASGVLLTTVTDVAGFFTFLGLATLVLL